MAIVHNAPVRNQPRSRKIVVTPAVLLRLSMSGLVLLGLALQPALSTHASPPYGLLKTYLNPSPAANEKFGNEVAWLPSGAQFVVGAHSDRLGGSSPVGAVYVLTTTTGAINHVLSETGGTPDDYFGYSVVVSGTRALVGAPLRNIGGSSNSGAAFLFDAATGVLLQSFLDPSPATLNNFGSSGAILSDTDVLIGVPQYLSTIGRAYICRVLDGTCSTAIDSPNNDGGYFGLSVAVLGDKFAVAAPFAPQHGKVYIFTTTSRSLYQTIELTTTGTGDNFGSAMAVVNGNLLIGAQNGPSGPINTPGAAYIFSPDGVLLQTFHNPNSVESARFGVAVAGDGNIVLIGAPDAVGTEGRAYVFDATTGALLATLQKPNPVAGDHFGNAVAMLGESFVVGAPDDGAGASGAGAVYRFGPLPPVPASFAGSSKTVNATSVWSGSRLTYTLTLTNSGTLSAGFALTDTLDSHVTLVSAPGLTGSSTLTATGVLTGLAQLTYQVVVQTGAAFNGSVANVAKLSGDGITRSLTAPLVAVTDQLFLPHVRR